VLRADFNSRLSAEPLGALEAPARPSWFRYETAKRALDLAMATLGLISTAPIWLAIVIAIKLDSPGPAIFVQERVGLNGRRFRFYKFRSMHVDAERRLAELRAQNEVDGPVFKMRKDPRISKVGAFLRRTSLDELPQLLNVLKGDMSMVGPRPPLPREVEKYRPSDIVRLSVKPGLTCLWQIRGRSTLGFETWMEYDREYISNLSLRLDMSILVRTVWAVLSCRGAY
jgi:exopolysaccharide biosynthesis polyprenyl glycosylphosphotransferase